MHKVWSYKHLSLGLLTALSVVSLPVLAQSVTQPTPRSVVAIPSNFQSVPVKPLFCSDDVSTCGRNVLYGLPANYAPSGELDGVSQEEVFDFKNGVVVYLLTIKEIQDDSVRAERYRVSFKKGEAGLRLVQVGRQNQCTRGTVRGWTKRLCP